MTKRGTDLLALVGQIYDAAAEPAEWSSVGLPIADAVGAKYAWLMMNDPEHPERCWNRAATGTDIWNYPLHQDPWYPTVQGRDPGTVVLGSERVTPAMIRDTDFFESRLRDLRIEYACMVIVERSDHNEHFFAFNRVPEAGDFSDDDLRLLAHVAPHLRRAYALHTRLHSPFAQPRRTDPALADSPTAAFLLDGLGTVRWMNAAAEGILEARDGIRLSGGQLRFDDPQAARHLNDDIAQCRITRETIESTPANVVRRCRKRSGGLPYAFSVTPQNDTVACLRFDCAAATCVLVDDLESSRAPSTLSLRNVFELTRAEAMVAKDLCGGSSVREIAEGRSTSIETVRTQIKRILAKVGVGTQVELVRRLSILARLETDAG